jgi:L,D-transpeptidase catalytic domain
VAAVVAAFLTGGLLWAEVDGKHQPAAKAASAADYTALPAPPAPALKIGRPERLRASRFHAVWTTVRARTVARARPASGSHALATLSTLTPEGTPNVLPVLGRRVGLDGHLWVDVRLPVLPNGTTGWVRRGTLGAYQIVSTHLVVDRQLLKATLYRDGKPVFTAPVGVGTDSSPTPSGNFTVRNELVRYASPFYGPIAFGTTARSAVLTDWPAGGFVGIHGTNEPELLPGQVSHGCIRLRNADILRLATMLPVGTPLTIR